MDNFHSSPRNGLRRARVRPVFGLIISLTAALAPAYQAAAGDRYVYIVNTRTHMLAEVFAHHVEVGARVVLWPHYGGESQQFKVEELPVSPNHPYDRPWFLLRARHSNKCLRAGEQSGAPVVQAVCTGEAKQMWRVRIVEMTPAECGTPNQCFGGRRSLLENAFDYERRCLDAANGGFPAPPEKGAGLQVFECIPKFSAPNAVNQEWELVNIQDWGAPGPVVR